MSRRPRTRYASAEGDICRASLASLRAEAASPVRSRTAARPAWASASLVSSATRLYFRNGRVKCELAVAKGKQDWDKRETEKRREADREARSAINASKHRMGK